jgi:putative tricarboxylic transport membrane protein
MKHTRLLTCAVAGAIALALPAGVMAADFPSRGLEFVAGYTPGGGHDIMLRTMAKIIQEGKIVAAPITVVNKPGGAGAVSLGYLNGHKGDGHFLMASTSSFITTPLTSNIGLNYKNFTPIARLGIDPELLLVNAQSNLKSLKDIAAAGKVLNVGGTGKGGIEQIVTVLFAKALGKKLNYIPFQSDGEVVTALLSNHVDFIVSNPGSAGEFIKTKQFVALAISTETRSQTLPDVPTFKEQGYDITLSLFRGVVAAGDIGAAEKKYLAEMVRKLSETEEWKKSYLEKNRVEPAFLGPDEYAAFLANMNEVYRTSLTELGIIK